MLSQMDREHKVERVARGMTSYFVNLSHGDIYYLRKNILEHLVLSKQTEEERKQDEEESNP